MLTNKWHHTSKAYDGKAVKMYIDGQLDRRSLQWGNARPGNVAATGGFDEVGFFTQALAEAEISQVMTQGLMKVDAVEPTTKLTV